MSDLITDKSGASIRALAERILADMSAPPALVLAAHRFMYLGDREPLLSMVKEAERDAD